MKKGYTLARKQTKGGRRTRLGRPPGDPAKVRRNKVFAMVTDAEIERLERLADDQDKPLSTVVYELLARALKRRK